MSDHRILMTGLLFLLRVTFLVFTCKAIVSPESEIRWQLICWK